jgi:hypothetical protein
MGQNETNFNRHDHYCTPIEVWGPIVDVLGGFGLDPFTNPNSIIPATHRWTDWGPSHCLPEGFSQKNGFVECWDGYGLVWCNGPFSVAAKYLAKCASEGDEVVYLCRGNVNARYFHKFVRPSDGLFMPEQRITFVGEADTAPFHCVLGYWGSRYELFARACNRIGGWVIPGDTGAR